MSTISPNMNLVVPTVSVDPGPAWASDIDASLSIIDSHNHSPGEGVQIQPNGLNINSDLSIQSNNLIAIRALRFSPQLVPIANSGQDIGELYVSGNELYFNDETGGHQVKITTNGSVNSGAGSITGLPSGTASASYSAGTFIFQSATSTAANLDIGSLILRNSGMSSDGLTLQAPTLTSNLTQTLPITPLAISFMQMDTLGNMSAPIAVTKGITATNIANNTITELQMAPLSIGTAELIANSVTRAKLAAVGQQISASCGSFNVPSTMTAVTNLSVTITTTGRPVSIQLPSDGSGGISNITVVSGHLLINVLRNGIVISTSLVGNDDNGINQSIPTSSISCFDIVAAGTYTYSVQASYTTLSSGNGAIQLCKLLAYEL
jgi:hypothetical protein